MTDQRDKARKLGTQVKEKRLASNRKNMKVAKGIQDKFPYTGNAGSRRLMIPPPKGKK